MFFFSLAPEKYSPVFFFFFVFYEIEFGFVRKQEIMSRCFGFRKKWKDIKLKLEDEVMKDNRKPAIKDVHAALSSGWFV